MRASFRHLVILGCCLLAPTAHGDGEEEEQRSRLEALKARIDNLRETLFSHTSEIDALEKQLEARETAAGELRAVTQSLERDIAELAGELERMERRRDELEQHSLDQQNMIARELNAAYRLGRSEPVKILLNQEDPYELARILKYYQYFATARQDKIHQFEKTIAELDAISRDILERQDSLRRAREENAIRLAELTLELERRQQLINERNRMLEDDRLRLARLNEERQQLEDLIASLEEELHDLAPPSSEPFAKLRGKLPWPASGPISQGFGSARGQGMTWRGWLIGAEAGAPVRAVHNGRIVFSDYFRGHGLMVIVDHGEGFLSLYSHNQLLLKEVGDWVLSGDAIAQAGATGGLAESALYFEIRHNGKPQDPRRWLKPQG